MVATAPFAVDHDQSDLRAYFKRLISECPLPLMLYHMPPLTRTTISVETAQWAADQPGIIGLKDSSGDLTVTEAFIEIARSRADWGVYSGADTLLAEAVKRGAHGGVSGGANIAPELFVELFKAAQRGDEPQTRLLHSRAAELVETLFAPERHPADVIKVIKAALAAFGLCSDTMAEPFRALAPRRREDVRKKCERLGL